MTTEIERYAKNRRQIIVTNHAHEYRELVYDGVNERFALCAKFGNDKHRRADIWNKVEAEKIARFILEALK